ncbi:hypothetical protein CLU79DRAFT_847741 [Phycomyces nitens]|nr:hypothetical protein CLU79DRAFT_847741 [Phycomyces nitens]
MLRTSSASAARTLQTACRPTLVSLRFQTSAAAEESNASIDDTKPATKTDGSANPTRVPLSARLGGSGRGKPLEKADPFSLFLANSRPPRSTNGKDFNRGRPNNRAPRAPKQAAPGQFDDAVETKPKDGEAATASSTERQSRPPRQPRNNSNNNSNSNNNNESTNAPNNNRSRRTFNDRRAGDANTGDRRSNDRNGGDVNNGDRRSNDRSKSFGNRPRRSEVSSTPLRRVVTFINKDIDWASLNPNEGVSAQAVVEGEVDSSVALAETQGDYERYADITNSLKWSETINVSALNTLVGGNATYSIPQKTAFLQTVSKATMGA